MTASKTILTKNNLRITRNRVSVLDIFLQNQKALSHSSLQLVLKRQINRVSLYRTLADLVASGLLSRLVDSEGVSLYLYAGTTAMERTAVSPHFKCKCCERVTVLPQLPPSYIEQVAAWGMVQPSSLLLEGICRNCMEHEMTV